MNMVLKPQDVLVLLKLVAVGSRHQSFADLAKSLHMSPSEVHAGLRRAQAARLYAEVNRQPIKENLIEFLLHGIKYAFPAETGGRTRGMATSYGAEPLKGYLDVGDEPLIPVWPMTDGALSGLSFSPLYQSVPFAASTDSALYELLCLVDAIRSGRVREQRIASELLSNRIGVSGKTA
jgi:DNA-binding Lrp family transcriptional regulator